MVQAQAITESEPVAKLRSEERIVNLQPGKMLRRAREECGLSESDIIDEIKIESYVLKAIEDDDYAKLPPPAYVRGYMRQYARIVNVDAEKLVELYESATGEYGTKPVLEGKSYGAKGVKRWAFPHPHVFILSVLMVATYIGVGFIWDSGHFDAAEETLLVNTGSELKYEQEDVADIAPVSGTLPPTPEDVLVVQEVESLEAFNAPQALSTVPDIVSRAGASSTTEPTGITKDDAEGISWSNQENVESSSKEVAAFETALNDAPPTADATWGKINLQFSDFTWVDIRDADGVRVIVGNFPAGIERNAEGRMPFKVTIGNAKGVQLTLNDNNININPYIRGDVAKFSLDLN